MEMTGNLFVAKSMLKKQNKTKQNGTSIEPK
jgi:hypothetical protein